MTLGKVTPAAVQACYGALLKGGLSARSVEQTHTVLHGALRQAVRWDYLGRNPCDAASPPRPERREMKTLTEEQVQRLISDSEEDRLHPLWVLLVTTGRRLGESTGLRWGDVDFEVRRLVVQRALQRQRGKGLVLVEPKTARSRRTVYLSVGLVEDLREHRKRQVAERLVAGPLWENHDLVFCNHWGRPIDPSRVNEAFHLALARAQLPRVRVHDLRHTAATLMLQWGYNPKVVQDMLGHSTVTLTLDTYSHVSPALHAEVAESMNALFGQQDSTPPNGKPQPSVHKPKFAVL